METILKLIKNLLEEELIKLFLIKFIDFGSDENNVKSIFKIVMSNKSDFYSYPKGFYLNGNVDHILNKGLGSSWKD